MRIYEEEVSQHVTKESKTAGIRRVNRNSDQAYALSWAILIMKGIALDSNHVHRSAMSCRNNSPFAIIRPAKSRTSLQWKVLARASNERITALADAQKFTDLALQSMTDWVCIL